MMRLQYIFLSLTLLPMIAIGHDEPPATLVVHDEVLHRIDPRLFGQFFERASFGEPGPEAFVDSKTGRLPESIMAKMEAMEIPLVRFPGGTDVDYIDWRDMIDNVPGRPGPRPVTVGHSGRSITNYFGYDEYFAVRDRMGWETILVVNLLDGLARKRPLEEAAQLAAGLVAYANAPAGATLPESMPDWPAVRAKNGHPEPFGIQFVQIGNEIFLRRIREAVKEATGLDGEALARWYIEVYTAYIQEIRKVDPSLPIIIDHWSVTGHWKMVLGDPYIREQVTYIARHKYAPGPSNQISRDEESVETDSLTDKEWWWAWATMPGEYDGAGQNLAFGLTLNELSELGYLVAATEWNWNGWNWRDINTSFEAPAAAGIGAAGWLQGMMRQGDLIRLGNQSMLLAANWQFGAIQGDPAGEGDPYYSPQGSATTFYRRHHGGDLLRTTLEGVPSMPQPYHVGWGPPIEKAALLDVLVTADKTTIFIHALNRSFDRDLPLKIDLTALGPIGERAQHHTFTCKLKSDSGHGASKGMAQVGRREIEISSTHTVMLPARTASIFAVPRTR